MAKPPTEQDVTPEDLYENRREFLKQSGLFVGTAAAWGGGLLALSGRGVADPPPAPAAAVVPPAQRGLWDGLKKTPYDPGEKPTPFGDVTTYNNYYELGLDKADPAQNAGTLKLRPWTVQIAGEVEKPQTVDVDQILHWFPLEERIYRFRCVERWAMVIPWVGFPLGPFLKRFNPTSRAKYVVLTTLLDEAQLPGQKSDVLEWPYVEGLRMDEAMNPLAMLAVGLYGKPLLGQNGAPIRLVVPWKYGFKSVKSVVKITLQETQPKVTWNSAAPTEYGFYANVNPAVDHPRWSQAQERPIGSLSNRPTLPFNGYGEEVASLYTGMDLAENF